MNVSKDFDRGFASENHRLLANDRLSLIAEHNYMLRLEGKFGVFRKVNVGTRLKESLNEEVRYGIF